MLWTLVGKLPVKRSILYGPSAVALFPGPRRSRASGWKGESQQHAHLIKVLRGARVVNVEEVRVDDMPHALEQRCCVAVVKGCEVEVEVEVDIDIHRPWPWRRQNCGKFPLSEYRTFSQVKGGVELSSLRLIVPRHHGEEGGT
jgi:hypothetical protein